MNELQEQAGKSLKIINSLSERNVKLNDGIKKSLGVNEGRCAYVGGF